MLGDYVRPVIPCWISVAEWAILLAMARLVGTNGKVIAVDLQPQMLKRLCEGRNVPVLQSRIEPHLCRKDSLGVKEPVDFVLAFWMVTKWMIKRFFSEKWQRVMKAEARFLVVEPKFHVTDSEFQKTAGHSPSDRPGFLGRTPG